MTNITHSAVNLLYEVKKQFEDPCEDFRECRALWTFQRFNFYTRAVFNLVTPSEVMTEEIHIPLKNIMCDAMMALTSFVALEYFYRGFIKGLWTHPANILPNLISGKSYLAIRLAFHGAEFWAYDYVYRNYRFTFADNIDWTSWIPYLCCAVFLDFCFYWFHRAAHEISLFWTIHQVHHSHEDYNYSTALRIGHMQDVIHFGAFYAPMALCGIPAPIMFIHKGLNVLAQFWIHTQYIPKMPFVEYFIQTPSLHRVHHARNPKYLDKNYGAILTIWDRMFGTFLSEDDGEAPVFGITKPQRSTNVVYFQHIGWYELYEKFCEQEGWLNKLQCIIKGPGWQPGSPWTGHNHLVPPADPTDVAYYQPLNWFWHLFVFLDVAISGLLFFLMLCRFDQVPHSTFYFAIFILYFTGYCLSKTLEQSNIAPLLQLSKYMLLSYLNPIASSFFITKTPIERLIFHTCEIIGYTLETLVFLHVVVNYTVSTKTVKERVD